MPATLDNKTKTLGQAAVHSARVAGVFSAEDERFLDSMHISLNDKPKLTHIRAQKEPLFERINSSMLMMAAWMAPAAIGGVEWVAKKTEKWGAMGKPFQYLGSKMTGPKAALQVELGHAASSSVESAAGWIKGRGAETPEAQAIAMREAGRMGTRVRFAERQIKNGADTLFTHIGTLAEQVTTKGPVGWARTRYTDRLKANIAGSNAQAVLHHDLAVQHLDDVLAKLSGPELTSAHGIAHTARQALVDAATSLKDRHGALNHADTGKTFEAAAQELAKSNALSAEEKAVLSEARAGMKQFTRYAAKAQGNFKTLAASAATIESLNNVKNTVAAIPGKLSKLKMEHVPNHAWYALSQGASAIRGMRAFTTRMDTLTNMYASVTGTDVKDVSGLKLVLGLTKLPDSMKGAAKEYWHDGLIEFGSQAAGMVAFHKINKPGSGFLLMMGVQGATSAITSIVAPKNSLLQAYRAIAEAHGAGQKEVPKTAYAALIVAAKPELRDLSINDPALLQVAQHYAQTNAKASVVLKDMDSKLFDKLMTEAKTVVTAAAAHAAAAKVPVGDFTRKIAAAKASPAAIAPAAGSHVERAQASKIPAAPHAALSA